MGILYYKSKCPCLLNLLAYFEKSMMNKRIFHRSLPIVWKSHSENILFLIRKSVLITCISFVFYLTQPYLIKLLFQNALNLQEACLLKCSEWPPTKKFLYLGIGPALVMSTIFTTSWLQYNKYNVIIQVSSISDCTNSNHHW